MEVSHIVVKKRGVSYSGREGWVLGGSQMLKVGEYFGSEGGFCERRI